MKIKIPLVLIFFVLILSSSCALKTNTGDVKPEDILKDNLSKDLFLMNDIIYVNATGLEWVEELKISNLEKSLGMIKRTGITKNFKNYDATKLPIDTPIFKVIGRNDITIVKDEGLLIPYLAWVEG